MPRPLAPAQVLNPNIGPKKPHPSCPQAKTELDRPGIKDVMVYAVVQESVQKVYMLRGKVCVETTDMLLEADEVEYDEESGIAKANGNVHFVHFQGGEEIWADHVEYDVSNETGKFYDIHGTAPGKIDPRPGLLTTTNPFAFQGKWAERLKDRYTLYDGFATNCRLTRPIWTLRAPRFTIIPGDHATAYRAWFKVRQFPLFYTPVFYKSLKKQPRKSGFLTPNAGNSSRRGKMIGAGYYWAINRSMDMTYHGQLFTQRGFAHTADFRGKPTQKSEFDVYLYGVNDKGLELSNGERRKEGGMLLTFNGRTELGHGFYARGYVNYLSSFKFRQAFTESFNEAVFAEVQSVGFVARHWSDYALNFVISRKENFQSAADDDKISIRRLPQTEFNVRDKLVSERVIPIWVSLDSSAGFLSRTQPLYQSRSYVQRADLEPRIMTAFRWKDFNIIPAFSIRETYEGSSFDSRQVAVNGSNIRRDARTFSLDLAPPSLAKVFDAPKWMGKKMKHVIEPRASFRWVGGIENFRNLILFDETELLSNTRELELSITNHFFVKREAGDVFEAFSWQVKQKRYFDPTFGGALSPDSRNVLMTGIELTGYSFVNGRRHYSPFISTMRVNPMPSAGIEWRTDYDPLLQRFTNSTITAANTSLRVFLNTDGTITLQKGDGTSLGTSTRAIVAGIYSTIWFVLDDSSQIHFALDGRQQMITAALSMNSGNTYLALGPIAGTFPLVQIHMDDVFLGTLKTDNFY
ncbi:MAG: LPS-assembly protein LptD, partial [Candidatus Solibacter usitatus]|nr:LPS-assembly protein LptD [Candidatus Solibacter usitatus]